MRLLLLIVLWLGFGTFARSSDVMARALCSSFVPTVSIRYSYRQEQPQVIGFALTWDFDEALLGSSSLVAIEIKRIEREKEMLARSYAENDAVD